MEISFKDIFRIIKKNIAFIIIISVITSMLSFFVTTFFVSKTYTATVKLYVDTYYDDTKGQEQLSLQSYAEKLVSTYMQLLDTNSFYSAVSKELGGKYNSKQLDAAISYKSIEDTEVFEAIVISPNPNNAKEIADTVALIAPKTIAEIKSNATLKIVDEATLPKQPTSPSTSKNVLIAFLLGLVAALIISFVREYFDIKIKYNEDMTTIYDIPILAAIPDFEYFTNNKKQSRRIKYGDQAATESKKNKDNADK